MMENIPTQISPMHLGELSRLTKIPLWNPDDPLYSVQDSTLMNNPWLRDSTRIHIPLGSLFAEKAISVPSFAPSIPESNIDPVGRVGSQPSTARVKTGTTPGGLSAALEDPDKVAMANHLLAALEVDPRTQSSALLHRAGIGPHRIRFRPKFGGWEEEGRPHVDPYLAVDVPSDRQGNPEDHIIQRLRHIFGQTAVGTEKATHAAGNPNAIGIRGDFDRPFSEREALELTQKMVQGGGGFAPDVYPGDSHARSILYPSSSHPSNPTLSEATGGDQGYRGGVIPYHHMASIQQAADAADRVLRDHGARNTRIFGLKTGYFDPEIAPDIMGHPGVQEAVERLAAIRQGRYGLAKGVEDAPESEDDMNAKVAKVMQEFKDGTLKTSSGETVTDRDQAIAIALSEAGNSRKG